MSDATTRKRAGKRAHASDWSRLDAMTAKERHAAALADPDAQPITAEDIASGRMPLVPQVWSIRRRLKLSQEEFAARFRIPVGTVRDWEQRRKEPDAAAKAYLRVIALEPAVVRKALAARPPRPKA